MISIPTLIPVSHTTQRHSTKMLKSQLVSWHVTHAPRPSVLISIQWHWCAQGLIASPVCHWWAQPKAGTNLKWQSPVGATQSKVQSYPQQSAKEFLTHHNRPSIGNTLHTMSSRAQCTQLTSTALCSSFWRPFSAQTHPQSMEYITCEVSFDYHMNTAWP